MAQRATDRYLQHGDRVQMQRTVSDDEIAACLPKIRRLAYWLLKSAPYQMDPNDLISAGVLSIMNFAYVYQPGDVPFWFAGRRQCKVAMWHEIVTAFRYRNMHSAGTDDYEEGKLSRRLESATRYAYPFFGKELKGPSKQPYVSDFIFALTGMKAEPGSVRDKMLIALIDLLDREYRLIIKSLYFHGVSGRNLGIRLSCTRGVIEKKRDLALCELRRKVMHVTDAEKLCRAKHKCSTVARLEAEREHEVFNSIVKRMKVRCSVGMLARLLTTLKDYPSGYSKNTLIAQIEDGPRTAPDRLNHRDRFQWVVESLRILGDAGIVERIADTYRITATGIEQLELLRKEDLLPVLALVA